MTSSDAKTDSKPIIVITVSVYLMFPVGPEVGRVLPHADVQDDHDRVAGPGPRLGPGGPRPLRVRGGKQALLNHSTVFRPSGVFRREPWGRRGK